MIEQTTAPRPCPSGKVAYVDELEAQIALNKMAFIRTHYPEHPHRRRAKRERSYYVCDLCQQYHLTSQAAKPA